MTKQIFKQKRKTNKILKGIAITVNLGVIAGLGILASLQNENTIALIGIGNVFAMLCNAMNKNIPDQINDAKENLVELLSDASPDEINNIMDDLTTQANAITSRSVEISIPDAPNTARTVENISTQPYDTPVEELEVCNGVIYLNPRTGMYKAVVPDN